MSAQMTADYIRLKELTKSDTFKQGMINDGIEQIAVSFLHFRAKILF